MFAAYRSPRLGLVALWLLAACSPSSSSSPSSSEPSASSLATSPQAMSLMTSLRQGFRLVPVVVPAEPGGSPSAPADPEPLLRRSEVERYEVRDGWVIPHLPDHALEGRLRPARVRLPLRASGAFEVKDERSGLGIRVKRVGGTEAVVEQAEGWAVYRGGLRGGDVVHRVHGEGTEDYVHVATKPEVEELRYVVDVSGVAGLRRVNNVVELLDGEGYPRLRIAAPLALDARGEKLAVRLEVEGCAYDEDPAAPWEREVVAPGASECEVVARWKGGEYPLVVDPAFVSAGSLAVGRSNHTASVLADGSVLVVGGFGSDATACPDGYCKTAERWVNGGFSAAGSLAVGRSVHTASALADGSVLVVGGYNDNEATACPSGYCETAERWVNGGFSAAGSLAVGRSVHTASVLADGSVLVVGGLGNDATACPSGSCETAERWVNGGFSAAGSLAVGRSNHTASALADGSVLVVGGYNNNEATACPDGYCKTAERWVNGGFSAAGSLAVGRLWHTASALADGSVLVVGGYGTDATACPNNVCKTAERWVNGGFSAAGSLAVGRTVPTASALADGSVLVVGGYGTDATACPNEFCKTAERWVNGGFSAAGGLAVGRYNHTASVLADGSVLVVGGDGIDATACPNEFCKTAERWDPTLPTVGMPCSAPSECPTGFCVDGVCCDKPCDGICEACTAAIKGFGSDGVCEPFKANTDPQQECFVQGEGVCQSNGFCDGSKAACQSKLGTICLPSSCSNSVTQINASTCDANGNCLSTGTSSCFPYACKGTGCLTSCSDNSDCAPGFACLNNECTTSQPLGTACSLSAQCQSGFCVEGVCCSEECDGVCLSCLGSKTGKESGTCAPVLEGTDPKGGCEPGDPSGVCPADGMCDGKGQCRTVAKEGTACGSTVCVGASVAGSVCDAQGKCVQSQETSCGAYTCKDGKCLTSCTTKNDCAKGFRCDGGVCVELKELGSSCTDGSECAEGFCAEGVCCDSPCLDACTTCTAIGKLGTCSLVGANQSPPPGKSCPGEGPCASFCDGTSPSCSKPSAGTSCAPASCSGNVLQPAGACDNAGLCVIPNPKPCDGNFACDSASATCKTSCSSPADCAQGYTCQNATCVQDSGAGGTAGSGGSAPVAGSGGSAPVAGSGGSAPVAGGGGAPVAGSGGSAPVAGSGGSAPVAGSGGSAPVAGGGGAPAAPTAAEEGGCGCALPGRSPSTRGAWLAAALGLAAFRRRRRAA